MYPSDGDDAFWQSQAQRLFTGLILYMLETPDRPCSMAELVKLTTPNKPLDEWITETINKRKADESPLSVECIEALMAFAGNSSENTRAGILSSLTAPLNIFTDPMVAAATSESDFRLDEVRKKRMSIYVGIQPNELPRFDKLLNLFFSQLINLNTRVLPEQDPSLKYQCLVLLDEFTALGHVEIINKAVAYIAGYNMRLMLIFQDRGQAEKYYTREGTRTLLSNMACQIIFAPRTVEDAEDYSKLLGTETVKGKSISRNRGKGGGGSVSTSDQSRALMLPQEMLELDQSLEIVKYNAFKPIKCEKIIFYNEPIFQSRLSPERDATGKQKGLPIKASCIPPQLDIEHMLEVMRGTKFEQIKSVAELKENLTGKELIKNHSDYIQKISDALGFDADFLNLEEFNF
jgi:type IV secretion system protein VirD4